MYINLYTCMCVYVVPLCAFTCTGHMYAVPLLCIAVLIDVFTYVLIIIMIQGVLRHVKVRI